MLKCLLQKELLRSHAKELIINQCRKKILIKMNPESIFNLLTYFYLVITILQSILQYSFSHHYVEYVHSIYERRDLQFEVDCERLMFEGLCQIATESKSP